MSKNGIDHKHCKWPLGLWVMVMTDVGYIQGRIHKHDRSLGDGAWVDFSPVVVTMQVRYSGSSRFNKRTRKPETTFREFVQQRCMCCLRTQTHKRYSHVIPFRSMKPLPGRTRPKLPWYKRRDQNGRLVEA